MLGVDAASFPALVINGMALGNLLPGVLLVDVAMGIDGGVVPLARNLLHPIAIPHGSRPQNVLVGIEVDGLQPRPQQQCTDQIDTIRS